MAVSSYTIKHFSPIIIAREFAHLKDRNSLKDLQDEALTIKVSTTANEVTASYIVDEQREWMMAFHSGCSFC